MATNIENVEGDKPKSRKPKDTKFKQQKLPAWQPILTANTVLPAFFAIGISFIPLGIALLITSNNIKEFTYDYTNCVDESQTNRTCAEFFSDSSNAGQLCTCQYSFDLSSFDGTVYMYYGLTNFYQNHRRYVKSRDDNQLKGGIISPTGLLADCEPYRKVNDSLGYAPCGAIANSIFNDTFSLTYLGNSTVSKSETVNLLKTGIAWSSDKNVKFSNPTDWQKSIYTHLPNWHTDVWSLDNDTSNNGYKNEDFIVWMRTAALPTFRKLYRRIDHSQSGYENGLPHGNYNLTITYAYPVSSFGGTKSFILSTTSWMGGKNPFLGIAYIVVGSICIVLGIVFLIINLKFGKKSSDLTAVTSRDSY